MIKAKLPHIIFLISCLCFTVTSSAQKKQSRKKYIKKEQVSKESLIKDARLVKGKNPNLAISYLEKAIALSGKSKNNNQAEIYFLLGNIFEDTDQTKDAIKRYTEASSLLDKQKGNRLKDQINARLGNIYLGMNDENLALIHYNRCIQFATSDSIAIRCKEGKADLYIQQKNDKALFSTLQEIERYPLDSLTRARLDSRKAEYFILQNDYNKATQNFNNAVTNIPRNQKLDGTDYEVLSQTQNRIYDLNNETTTIVGLVNQDTLTTIASLLPKELEINKYLQAADAYAKVNNWNAAKVNISSAENLIDGNTSKKLTVDIYEKSVNINEANGDIKAAFQAQKKAIEANKQLIAELENKVDQQVNIGRGQSKIDLLQKDFTIEQKDAALLSNQLRTQKILTGLLGLLLLGSLVFFYFLNKSVKEKRKANQLLYLKSLRTQMNPHFIFNALNSVNNFIAQNDEKAANKFLANFSKLMRQVLDNSQKEFIPFEEEMALNQLYLNLEHFRFRDKFEYTFENKIEHAHDLAIPPMLIQPFIENAVWHGLRYKEGMGILHVSATEKADHVVVEISDNGIGRAKSKALKTKNQKQYKSTGLDNVAKRIALINEIYNKQYQIKVADLDVNNADIGTIVQIKIPLDSQ